MESGQYPKRATLNDVAQAAGVSYQTVSRVINESPQVSVKTRLRVLKAIETLGFHPNRAAQALAKRRTSTLEVIAFGLDYVGPVQILSSIERAARIRGYKTMFSTTEHRTIAADELQVLAGRLSGMVDGVLVIAPVIVVGAPQPEMLHGLPVLQVGNPLGESAPSVAIDQFQGSVLATQHLISLGHRHIAEIAGPLDWHEALQRHHGWESTLRQQGLNTDLSVSADWTAAGGYQAMQHFLDRGELFTGLVVANDQMALGAIRALDAQHLKVPQDVSIVGFDDVPEAAYFAPALTTVRQDFATLGAQSVEYLIELIELPETPQVQHVLHPMLIERASTRRVSGTDQSKL